jgi:hypothetical protein
MAQTQRLKEEEGGLSLGMPQQSLTPEEASTLAERIPTAYRESQ